MAANPAPPARDRATLDKQMRTVERFIAGSLTADDYAAMSLGRGYVRGRMVPRGFGKPRGRIEDIPHVKRPECTDQVCLCPSPATSPPFEAEVVELLDHRPIYLTRLVWPAVRALPSAQQMILLLHCKRAMGFIAIAKWRGPLGLNGLGLKKSRLQELHAEALEAIARAVWDEAGMPRWEGSVDAERTRAYDSR